MTLTHTECEMIAIDVGLGRPLRVKGPEAEKAADSMRAQLERDSARGIVTDIPHEIPDFTSENGMG